MRLGIAHGAQLALAAAAMLSLAGTAGAQQGQGESERPGIGGRPATSARPDSGRPSAGGATDCRDDIPATCNPSSETRGVSPGSGDSGAPMTGSTGSSGTGATQGGNNPSSGEPAKGTGGR
jgi:hypothetical protein